MFSTSVMFRLACLVCPARLVKLVLSCANLPFISDSFVNLVVELANAG